MPASWFATLGIDAAERRRVAVVIALVLLAAALPYAWVAQHPPREAGTDFVYFGLLMAPPDPNVHLMWAKQAAQGHFFFRDLFTTEGLLDGTRPLFTNLFCWFMGVLSALSHMPAIWIFHALRLLCTAALLWIFYALCAVATADKAVRFTALLLAAFTSGAGWLRDVAPGAFARFVFIDRPDDTRFPMMPEAFTFASVFVFALFAAAMALLAFIYLKLLQMQATGDSKRQRRDLALACGAALLLGHIHTYDALPLMGTLALWTALGFVPRPVQRPGEAALARWGKEVWAAFSFRPEEDGHPQSHRFAPLLVAACALLPVVAQWLVFRGSEEFRRKALTLTQPPPFVDVALSFGPLLALAVVGVLVARRDPRVRLLALWAIVTLALIYAPVSFSRKMIEGVHLPLCLLAALGLVALARRAPGQLPRLIAGGTIALMSVSSVQFVAWCLNVAAENDRSRLGVLMPPPFLSTGDAAALRFLDNLPPIQTRDTAVLCLPLTGNYVPRETGMFTYAGHWAETLDFGRKYGFELQFYSGHWNEATALQWLREQHIGYVLEGYYEKKFGAELGWPPLDRWLHLEKVFAQDGTTLYRVPPA